MGQPSPPTLNGADARKTILHVGCGPAPLPASFSAREWREIRYDIDPEAHPDIVGSITDMSMLATGSVDAVFSSHNLEHLPIHEVPRALAEFRRVLRPGGAAWILVPDVQSLAERIATGDLEGVLYQSTAGPIAVTDVLWGHGAALAAGKHYMAHRCGFSADTLARHLTEAGFDPVRVQRNPGAFELFATAMAPEPQATPEQLFEEGRRLHGAGRWGEAEALYRRVVEQQPAFWPAHLELGVVCYLQQRLEEAIEHLQSAVSLEPRHVRSRMALGTFLGEAGRPEQAALHLQQAVALDPASAEAHYNLGKAWQDQQAYAAAEAAYREAIRLNPHHGTAHIDLSNVLREQGRVGEAIAHYRQGLPHVAEPGRGWHSNVPMLMNFSDAHDDQAVFEAHRAFDRDLAAPLARALPPLANPPLPERRLRLGYVSRDLRLHSVRYFLEPILAHHDHDAFEVICYHDNTKADAVTGQFKALADRWVECHDLDDARLAERIRADGIDILVDLGGHTDRNRLLTFARRPAPVQVTYLGYPASTGLAAIDYRVSDRHIDPQPPAAPVASSEAPLRLEHGYFCYAPMPDSPAVGPLPLDQAGHVTFGSLNQITKLTPTLLANWGELLRRLPNARMWLQNSAFNKGRPRSWLLDALKDQGVDEARLELRPFGPIPAYLSSYHHIDIALDSYPYNGGTTTCEALWMGVPVVSWRGGRHVGRLGASILGQLGLDDLVADSAEDYVQRALALAADVDRLRQLRAGLRARMAASPLMDHTGFTRELESAFRSAWRRWCQAGRA